MYANYFLINQEFLSLFNEQAKDKLSEIAYSAYKKYCAKNTKPLSKAAFLTSTRTRYPIVFFYCPKCKASMIAPMIGGFKAANGLKFCPHCGEPSIDHRFDEGIKKVLNLLRISKEVSSGNPHDSKHLNQCILTTLCSVYEVYLREFYADILNAKFVRGEHTLYKKFLKDCKNDFLNPGKTSDRLRKELGVNYKQVVGNDAYKALTVLSDYRNVIVHNNGICDDTFISQHPNVERHAQILPSLNSTAALIQVVIVSANKMDELYQNEMREAAVAFATDIAISHNALIT